MSPAATPRVVIDCDTGIDDALALVYLAGLHAAGEIELVAATTTAGNTTARQAAANTRYILDLCGLGAIPVFEGAPGPLEVELVTTPETHGPSGLGYATAPAAAAGATVNSGSAVRRVEAGEVWRDAQASHLIITGPATNAARWTTRGAAIEPAITLMGGSFFYPGNTTPVSEWNSWVDPHAAAELYRWAGAEGRRITVCALGLTEQFTIEPRELDRLREALNAGELAVVLGEALRWYFEFHQTQGEGYLAQMHDVLTCMIALDRIEFQGSAARVGVDVRQGETRGMTIADRRGHWRAEPNARIIDAADISGAHRELAWAIGRVAG